MKIAYTSGARDSTVLRGEQENVIVNGIMTVTNGIYRTGLLDPVLVALPGSSHPNPH